MKINRKKNKEQRRKRPTKSVSTAKIVYLEVPGWSNSGIKYPRLKKVLTKIQ